MGFRNLFIENPAKISNKDNQLIIQQKDAFKIPIEDINTIIIDNQMCNITTSTIAKCTQKNVAIYFCDEKHLPCSISLPFENYYHKLPILTAQFKMSRKAKGRLWQKIIKNKINNQANNIVGNEYKEMMILQKAVLEYDTSYCEANAARIYFRGLFGQKFKRRNNDIINASLNYGYALVRGIICRDLCAYGLEPSLALYHHNQLNAFNLADDLIEPFRGLIDKWVIVNCLNKTSLDKESLLKILFCNIKINNKYQSLSNAVNIMVNSYKECCLSNSAARLILPENISLTEHEYE